MAVMTTTNIRGRMLVHGLTDVWTNS